MIVLECVVYAHLEKLIVPILTNGDSMTESKPDGFIKWEPLNDTYFDPADLSLIARAQSLARRELGYTPTLTIEEAREILKLHEVHV